MRNRLVVVASGVVVRGVVGVVVVRAKAGAAGCCAASVYEMTGCAASVYESETESEDEQHPRACSGLLNLSLHGEHQHGTLTGQCVLIRICWSCAGVRWCPTLD
jgi:hypothetical protein